MRVRILASGFDGAFVLALHEMAGGRLKHDESVHTSRAFKAWPSAGFAAFARSTIDRRQHLPDTPRIASPIRSRNIFGQRVYACRVVTAGKVRRVSAAVINVETAVLSWAAANGFAMTTLPGTPFDDHSWALSPVI